MQRVVLEDRAVDALLDLLALLRRELLVVREVEAQLVGRTAEPACLTWSPSTSRSASCRRCVAVWFAIVGKRTLHGTSARTRLPAAKPEPRKTSTWSSPTRCACDELGARAGSPSSSITPWSETWPPPAGIERRLAQLREEGAVAEILVGVQLGEHVGLVVADERRRVGVAGEVGGTLRVRLAAGARDLAVLRHPGAVVVDVDRLAALLGELDRELEREAVGRREREGVLARDRVLAGELLEHLQAALERLAEPLLLGLDDRSISSACSTTSGYHGPTCSTTIARQPVDARRPIRRPARPRGGSAGGGCSRGPRSTA